MTYLKATVGAFAAALVLGAASGFADVFRQALASIPPEDKATIYASSISAAINSAAFYLVVLIPFAVVVAFFVRRRLGRAPRA